VSPAGSRERPIIYLDGVSVRRGGRTVLRDVALTVGAGSIVGLLGPSGCGKTTLMRTIVGVQAEVDGSATVLGRPAGQAAAEGLVGYMTQDASVYDDLSVGENLRYFAALLGVDRERVAEVLDQVELDTLTSTTVDRLSGGQRARVSLAVALLNRPPLLVLDEPTVGLDPVLRRALWRTFARLAAAGATVLVSSHVMDEAEHCDHLLLMREGRFLAEGAPADLMARTGTSSVGDAFLALIDGAERAPGEVT
jgi:ABC-2 type transport system ATP-binding protein